MDIMSLTPCSVQFSCSVVSNSLRLHGLRHTRLPCPSPTPGACSHTCPLSQWWYLTISSTATPFSFCPQSFKIAKKMHKAEIKALILSVQFNSVSQSCLTLCDPMECSTPGFPVHHQLPELAQTHVLQIGDAIQPSHPLSSPSLPAFNLSQHRGFSNESVLCIKWPKYWSFSFSINPSKEYSGLISFRIDWFDLLAVKGTLCQLGPS